MHRLVALLAPLFTPLVVSCTTLVPAPELDLTGRDPQAAWARTLERFVSAEGTIDFTGLEADPHDLETFVAWVARPWSAPGNTGPEDGDAARLAYWINAYNALAMYNVLHAGVRPRAKVRFFYLRELEQDGRRISLYDFENDVIRKQGDPRIHFALNCMVRSCPRLPREPFLADRLDAQLDAAAREFLRDPKHVELSADRRSVRLSSILKWYEEDFLAVAPSLVDYVNRFRQEPLPADVAVSFKDYDWTLNQAR